MIATGRYLLLIATLSGVTLSVDDRFSEEGELSFNDVQKTKKANSEISHNNYLAQLKLHNAVRLKHNAKPLKRTDELDFVASRAMKPWLKRRMTQYEHFGVVGDDRRFINSTQLNVEEAITFFSIAFEEGTFYDYESEIIPYGTGNFTQIVWGATKEIGLSFSYGKYYYKVLAVYSPCGNIPGQFQLNVLPPKNSLPAIDPDIPGLIYKTGTERFFGHLLKLHNDERAKHGLQELIRDVCLDDEARSMLLNEMTTSTTYGVNSYAFGSVGDHLDEKDATDTFLMWYRGYLYDSDGEPPNTYDTNQHTQIMCPATRKIGISIQPKQDYQYHVIAVYEPSGNIPVEYKSSMLMPGNMYQGESSGNY